MMTSWSSNLTRKGRRPARQQHHPAAPRGGTQTQKPESPPANVYECTSRVQLLPLPTMMMMTMTSSLWTNPSCLKDWELWTLTVLTRDWQVWIKHLFYEEQFTALLHLSTPPPPQLCVCAFILQPFWHDAVNRLYIFKCFEKNCKLLLSILFTGPYKMLLSKKERKKMFFWYFFINVLYFSVRVFLWSGNKKPKHFLGL